MSNIHTSRSCGALTRRKASSPLRKEHHDHYLPPTKEPNRRAPAGWPNHRRRSVETIVDAEFRLREIDIEGEDELFDCVETFEEEAERIADEARIRAALQLAKDVLAGEFDPERVQFHWADPQIFSYP